jgi:PAS domain S-box-containing protein
VRTVIIGGGRRCRAIIELARSSFLKELTLDILCIADPDPSAQCMMLAREHGIKTTADMNEALSLPMIDVVIELTGKEEVLEGIHKIIPPGTRVLDHTFAKLLMDLAHAQKEQARQLQEITALEQRFRGFIDSAHDWIALKDLEGRYIIVSRMAARQLHMNPEDFTGKTPDEILPAHLAEMVMAHDREVLRVDRPCSFNEIVTIDGRDQHFLTNRFPLKDYSGRTIGTCNIMRNVTSEFNLRKQLEQAGKLAAIGKLAAGVAHEINNPLTGVLAYAEDLIERTPKDNPDHQDLKVIMRETLRCREIVKNLLDFSRQENPRFERMDLNRVVRKSIELVRKLPEFRNVKIAHDLSPSVPNIQGDPQQIQQVLLNFMMNAAEAMKGKGEIALVTRHDGEQDKSIVLVEDNGPGIPENLRDKIFEPFFSTKGTNGLGLAVSWGIIERHLGTIEVEMSPSGGACFRIIFPIMEESPSAYDDMA